MQEGTDYLFFKKVTMSGYIDHTVMICTPAYCFFIVYENFHILNNWGISKGTDTIKWEFNEPAEIFEDMDSIKDMEDFFKANLKEANIVEIKALEKIKIQTGFLGSILFKTQNQGTLIVNLSKKNRIKVHQFYGME